MAALVRSFNYPATPTNVFLNGTSNSAYNTANSITDSLAGGNISVAGYGLVQLFISEITNAGRAPTGVADTGSTTYSRVAGGSAFNTAIGQFDYFSGVASSNAAGQDVIWTLAGNNDDITSLINLEFSGLNASHAGALISTNTQFPSGANTQTSGTVTPTDSNGVMIAMSHRPNDTYTEDTNFTEINTGRDNFYCGYWLNPPSGVANGLTYTSTAPRNTASVVIWIPGAPVAANRGMLLLLGVG